MMTGINDTNNDSSCSLKVIPPPFNDEDIIVICMLSVFSVVGTIGNGLVIYVYFRKKDKLTSNVFILALAITDFITSLLIMPYTVVYIYQQEELIFDPFCKIYHFLITSNVPLSAFIMVAIAVDRYLCICHPFLHLLTVPRAKMILLLQLAFTAVLGLMTSLIHSVYQLPSEIRDESKGIGGNMSTHFEKCSSIYTGRCRPTTGPFMNNFSVYYQKVYSSFFLISLLLVFTLYIMIYKFVTMRRARRQKQKHGKQFTTIMIQTDACQMNSHENQHAMKVEVNQNGVTTTLLSLNSENGDEDSHKRKSTRERRDHNHLANIKTAIMLFVVAVVFIIAFLPAWLMALGAVIYKQTVFYFYFIYNVVNPIIYAFMNQTFRADLQKVFGTCFAKR